VLVTSRGREFCLLSAGSEIVFSASVFLQFIFVIFRHYRDLSDGLDARSASL
jgi:hypothetical protein